MLVDQHLSYSFLRSLFISTVPDTTISFTVLLQAWVELHKFQRLVIYGHFHFLITDMVLFFFSPYPHPYPDSQGAFHLFCSVPYFFVFGLSCFLYDLYYISILPFKFLIFEDFLLGSFFMLCTQCCFKCSRP